MRISNNKTYEVLNFCESNKHSKMVYSKITNIPQSYNLGNVKNLHNVDLSDCNCIFVSSPGTSVSKCGLEEGIVWKCAECHHTYNPLLLSPQDRETCPVCGGTRRSETASSLVVYWLNELQHHRPDLMIFENVAGFISRKHKGNFDLIVEEIKSYGYNVYWKKMKASDYGTPLNCERVVMVCILAEKDNGQFHFPAPVNSTTTINDYLDDCSSQFSHTNATIVIDRKICDYIVPAIVRDIEQILTTNKPIFNMECESGFSDHKIGITRVPTLRSSNPSTIVLQTLDTYCGKKYYIKRLSAIECYKLMGFSERDFRCAWSVCGLPQIYKQAANTMPVNMIYKVFESLYLAMPYLFTHLKVVSLFSGVGSFEKALERLYKVINITETIETENSTDTVDVVVDNTVFLLLQLLRNKHNRIR